MSEKTLLPGLLFAGGILLAVIITLRHTRRAGKRTNELDRDPRERIDELHARSMAGRDRVEELMSDAEQLTRRLAATLDNKAARLEILLEQAERTLARLEGEHAPASTASPPDRQEWFTPAPSPDPVARTLDHDVIYRLADAGRAPADIARELGEPVGQVELILNLRRRQSG